jgi:hypothetical protein
MTTDQWAAVVGFVLPVLVAIINREPWSPWLKAVIALLTSVAGGTVTALLAGQFTGTTWLQAIGVSFAASQVFYMAWWKKSGITDWIEQRVLGAKKVIEGEAAPVEDGTPGDSSGASA